MLSRRVLPTEGSVRPDNRVTLRVLAHAQCLEAPDILIIMIAGASRSTAPPTFDPKRPLREFGELMHQSWQIKPELADNVSNSQIDEIYEAGRDAGAVGGKLLGAGGGGFMVLLVDPEKRAQVRERL